MKQSDYIACDATDIARLIRNGDVSASEVTACAHRRIGAMDDDINAVSFLLPRDAAIARSEKAAQGPFQGVPFLIKDLMDVEGMPTSFGSRQFEGVIASSSAVFAKRAEQAGLVCIGKSATSEFGMLPVTRSPALAETLCPFNMNVNAGGSSGGAAAAVAAGYVPMAHAGDGFGSIRIPASVCGLFGLKVSRGRYSTWPNADIEGLAASQGVISRTVRDTAAFLDATVGNIDGDRWLQERSGSYVDALEDRGMMPLRIGVIGPDVFGAAYAASSRAAVDEAVRLCNAAGHEVENCYPQIDKDAFWRSFKRVVQFGTARRLLQLARNLRIETARLDVSDWVATLAKNGSQIDGNRYLEDLEAIQGVIYDFSKAFTSFDVLLSPTLADEPVTAAYFDAPAMNDIFDRFIAYAPCLPICNLAGLTAMTIPVSTGSNAHCQGAHFVARPMHETTLLRLAAQLERERPWKGLRERGVG